jgi:hypothetical protein
MDCVYLGEPLDNNEFECRVHGKCKKSRGHRKIADCSKCREKLLLEDKDFSEKWIDPLHILDRHRHQTDALRDLLSGDPAFLVCGGPSANDLPLEHLNDRGVFTFCVNNVAGHSRFRPNAFVCSDPPMKFSHSIWFDKQIMKFVPTPKMSGGRSHLRTKTNGEFQRSDRKVLDCPNIWGFKRESWFTPDALSWLSDGACWGNHKAGTMRTGEPKTVCTMLLGLRLLYYLGARRIYLIGVDFSMTPDCGYSFGQGRTEGAAESNNRQFGIVNKWICEMVANGVFSQFGLEVFNCFEMSGLRAFPYVPFDLALKDVIGEVEQSPDLVGWYEKK